MIFNVVSLKIILFVVYFSAPDFSEALNANAAYTFENQELKVSFSSDKLDWKPVSIVAHCNYSKQKITQANFLSKGRTIGLGIDLMEFNRHCLQKRFTLEITFVYDEDKNAVLRTQKYNVKVSTYVNFIISLFHELSSSELAADTLLPGEHASLV